MDSKILLWGFLASLGTGLATGIGALPVLFLRDISDRVLDSLLGFAAGVMLAASMFSLLVPAVEIGGIYPAVIGLIIGSVFVDLLDMFIPHMHFISGPEGPSSSLRKIWLFIFAITLHNFPEGLSVGVSFGTGDITSGLIVAIAIGLQNIPEGSGVAFPLVREGYSRFKAVLYATLSGLAEPIAGLIGVLAVSLSTSVLPYALAFAAGAMIYVISDEIIPESHRKGFEKEATFGLIAGFIVMMFLDNALKA
ncbi:MAG: ZIP family metal transporter [Thermoprotei archaeon]|nr:MAG: ZIP family metal transporter [Thermoprotei archaeon]